MGRVVLAGDDPLYAHNLTPSIPPVGQVIADHKGHPSSPLFLTLEMIVTVAIVLEIMVRGIVLRKKLTPSTFLMLP